MKSSTTRSTKRSAGHAKRDQRHPVQGQLAVGGRRRPRHAGRHPPEGEGERRRADPHAPARGRKIQRQELRSSPAACTASACRSSTRCRSSSTCWIKRDGKEYNIGFKDGRSALQARGRRHASGSATPAPRCASGPTRNSSTPPSSRCRCCSHVLRAKAVLCPGLKFTFENEATNEKDEWFFDGGLRDYLKEELGEARRAAGRACSRSTTARRDERRRMGAGLDAGRRAACSESYVNLIPTAAGRHARERPAHRLHRRGARVLRVPQPAAARHEARARRRLGPRGASCCRSRSRSRSSPARRRSASPSRDAAALRRRLRARFALAVAQPASRRGRAHRAVRDRERAGAH